MSQRATVPFMGQVFAPQTTVCSQTRERCSRASVVAEGCQQRANDTAAGVCTRVHQFVAFQAEEQLKWRNEQANQPDASW